MIREITIGQYYPAVSYIHRLDPRMKIIATFLYILSLFFVQRLWAYLIVIAYLAMVIYSSRVPLKFIFRGLRGIVFLIACTVLINIFMTKGERVLFHYSFITITYEGVLLAALMGIRLILLLIGSSMLTLTTSPIQLTDGIEALLRPLKRIGVPSHEIAMMMTIALRFIPTLLEETDKIMKAQTARGADFESGGLIKRAKSMLPLLTPLFISAFRRADDLAMAMESRCYNGGDNRTRLRTIRMTNRDYASLAFVLAYVLILYLVKVYF